MRLTVGRDLGIAHGFEQRTLRARRSTVDFVGQHDVAEHRTAVVDELAGLRVENAGAGDVAGKQVGGELNAGKCARHALGKRLADERLADARNVFQQRVLAGQQSHDAQPDHLGFAQDDLGDVLLEFAYETEELGCHALPRSRIYDGLRTSSVVYPSHRRFPRSRARQAADCPASYSADLSARRASGQLKRRRSPLY